MRGKTSEKRMIQAGLRPILTGVISGILLSVVLLFLFAGIVSARDVPQAAIDPMAIFSLCAGAFLAGLVCTRITRSGGLAYGACCGGVLSIIILIGGLLSGAGGIGFPAVFRVIFLMLTAMIGGVIGVNFRRRR